jgi:hypothetical protein
MGDSAAYSTLPVSLGIDPGYSCLPQTKIIMYNDFGVLLACENVGKFLAMCRVGA